MLASAIHQHKSATGIHLSPRSWTSFPPPIPSRPSRLSQSAGFELPASYSKFPLFVYSNKWNNRQRVNLQNIQAVHTAQYQKITFCSPPRTGVLSCVCFFCPTSAYFTKKIEKIIELWMVFCLEHANSMRMIIFCLRAPPQAASILVRNIFWEPETPVPANFYLITSKYLLLATRGRNPLGAWGLNLVWNMEGRKELIANRN